MDTRLLHHISQHQPERQGFNLSRWAIEHTNFTRFLLVLILGSGIFALTNLGQKEDPEFKFRVMIVQVLWPGSSVHEMQEQVVDKIERKIQETPQLDNVQSYTHPGSAVIFVNLKGEARGGEVSDAFYQVRKKVGDIRGTLPAGVLGPFFNDEFGDTYIALYALSGEGFTYPELRDFARDARDILLRVPGAGKVDLLGVQDEKLFIEIASRVLAERNISPQDIQAALAGQNSQAPAGTVQTNDRSVRLDVQGTLLNVDQVENLRVRAGSQTIRLGDIATIKRGVEDPPISKIRHDGKESVVLGVVMAKGHNAVNVGEELDAALRRISNVLPVGAQFDKISDQPAVVTKAVSEFLEALGEALLIVLAVSLFSLGWRAGLVVALTIPLVLAATFLVMYIAGIDLQRISLGALIIALGLLVDDAMIAVEMMERKLEEGYGKLSAASFAYNSTAFPMLTGTLITTAGFVPVGFAASTPGEYVQTLFWVVGVSLIASWFAAVYFTPWLGFMLLKERAAPESNRRDVYSTPRYHRLRAAVAWCIRWRKTVVMSALAAFALAGLGFGFIPQQFFPSTDRPEILADLWLPEGASYRETEAEAIRFEQRLLVEKDIGAVTAFIGAGVPRFFLPLDQQLQNQNFSQFLVLPKDAKDRDAVIGRMRAILATDFPRLRVRVDRLFFGPPAGWPVQFRVQGPDRDEIRGIAEEVKKVAAADARVFNVHSNWHELAPSLTLDIDQDRARAIGGTSASVRQALQATLSGVPLGEFREKDQTIGIVLREPEPMRSLLSAVEDAYVKTDTGASVPVTQLAGVQLDFEPGVEWRRDRLPTITVQALIPDGIQSSDVTKAIYKQLEPLRKTLPFGYRIEMQGAVEESATAQASIDAKIPVLVITILLLLMVQLQSLAKTMLVLATAPLGIIGAAAALLLFQQPFGFVAILGVIALAGIIMRNGVILVDQIKQEVEAGTDAYDAIIGSAVRRFRPIVLTASAAVLALIPLAGSAFWGPMSLVIMGGLIAATILTLTFLPALYALAFGVRTKSPPRLASASQNHGTSLASSLLKTAE